MTADPGLHVRLQRASLPDITVRPGETLALFGPSRADTSALLRLLADVLSGRTTSGACEATLGGVPGPVARGDVVLLGADGRPYPASRVAAVAARLRGSAGTPARGRRSGGGAPRSSGGGSPARALVKALERRPRVLLLDDPLALLGTSTPVGRDVAGLRHPQDGTADGPSRLRAALSDFLGVVVMATGDARVAEIADTVAAIDGGEPAQIGSPAELRAHPRSKSAARLAGVNFFTGLARGHRLSIGHSSISAPTDLKGRVLITLPPDAVTVYPSEPEDSGSDDFEARIARLARGQGGRKPADPADQGGRQSADPAEPARPTNPADPSPPAGTPEPEPPVTSRPDAVRLGLSPVDPERGLELTALADSAIPWTLGQRVFARVDTGRLAVEAFDDD